MLLMRSSLGVRSAMGGTSACHGRIGRSLTQQDCSPTRRHPCLFVAMPTAAPARHPLTLHLGMPCWWTMALSRC